jgi:hypothetical protein
VCSNSPKKLEKEKFKELGFAGEMASFRTRVMEEREEKPRKNEILNPKETSSLAKATNEEVLNMQMTTK